MILRKLIVALALTIPIVGATATTASAGLSSCSVFALANPSQVGAGVTCSSYGSQFSPGVRIVVVCVYPGGGQQQTVRGSTKYVPNASSSAYCPVGKIKNGYWAESAG